MFDRLPRKWFLCLLLFTSHLPAGEPASSKIDSVGTVHSVFSIPLSRYMSDEARRKWIDEANKPPEKDPDPDAPVSVRRAVADAAYRPIVARAKAIYPVSIEERRIGGIPTQIVTPKRGMSGVNRKRVLINLHGGGFIVGAGLGGLAESIPVAALGGLKVITVDYREAPEYQYPAATEDVTNVYAELRKVYRAENIGIYGCSAGGILTAQVTAWLEMKGFAAPGAIGILGAGAFGSFSGAPADPNTWGGDSRFMGPILVGETPPPLSGAPPDAEVGAMNYTGNTDPLDPLVSPALSPTILSKFPTTLLISGTRSYDLSAAVQTQRELTKAGVTAELHLWDGMEHCFYVDGDTPESKEAFAVIAQFFNARLGQSGGRKILR